MITQSLGKTTATASPTSLVKTVMCELKFHFQRNMGLYTAQVGGPHPTHLDSAQASATPFHAHSASRALLVALYGLDPYKQD